MLLVGKGPDSLGATGTLWRRARSGTIYTEHPQKVRSSQSVTKQVDRKSSMDRTGRVGLPGVTDDYPPTICNVQFDEDVRDMLPRTCEICNRAEFCSKV